MKPHVRIILLLLAVIVITALISPLLKLACDSGVKASSVVASQLRYRSGRYDFGKAVRRTLMIVALVLFVWQRKKLRIAPLTKSAFRDPKSGWRRLLLGFALGMVSLSIYTLVLWLTGARQVQLNVSQGPVVVAGKLCKYLVSALAVGITEELLFRAFMVKAFSEGLSLKAAVGLSSFIYSILHFFRASFKVTPDGTFDVLVGLKVIAAFARPIFSSDIIAELPEVVGLFLTGVALSIALVRTGNLYLSIGLHAGWVFVLKTSKLLLRREVTYMQWLFGVGGTAGGVLSWLMLIGICWLLMIMFKPARDDNSIPGQCDMERERE